MNSHLSLTNIGMNMYEWSHEPVTIKIHEFLLLNLAYSGFEPAWLLQDSHTWDLKLISTDFHVYKDPKNKYKTKLNHSNNVGEKCKKLQLHQMVFLQTSRMFFETCQVRQKKWKVFLQPMGLSFKTEPRWLLRRFRMDWWPKVDVKTHTATGALTQWSMPLRTKHRNAP